MATPAVERAPGIPVGVVEPLNNTRSVKKHNVETVLNYYADPGDGSPPAPTYVGYATHRQPY
jgi:hypothetical protein